MNFSSQGWQRSQTDVLYVPQAPALVCTTDNDPRQNAAAAAITTTGSSYGARAVMPRTGTLTDLAIYVGTSSGNVDVGVLDTNGSSRTRLYSTGSIACPAGNSWTVVGNPNLAVTAGQQVDLVLACDNTTATFLRMSMVTAANALPTNFWVASGGAVPKIWWVATSSFPIPNPITEASMGGTSFLPLIIARII